MKYICIGYKTGFKTVFNNAEAEFDILAHSGNSISFGFLENFFGNPHVKTAWMESTHMSFIAPYSPGGERRSHGIANGFLDGGERLMGLIRAAIGIQPVFFERLVNRLHVVAWDDTIRIKNNQVIALSPFESIIPAKTLSAVFFIEVFNDEFIGKRFCDIFTGHIRAIFNY